MNGLELCEYLRNRKVIFKDVIDGYEIHDYKDTKHKIVFIAEDDLYDRGDRIAVKYDDYSFWFQAVTPNRMNLYMYQPYKLISCKSVFED